MVQVKVVDKMDWASVSSDSACSDADVACRDTVTAALYCVCALLACPAAATAQHLPVLTTLLATFSASHKPGGNASEAVAVHLDRGAWHAALHAPKLAPLIALLPPAAKFFRQLARGAEGCFEHEIQLLRIQMALVELPALVMQGCRVADVGELDHLPQTQRQVCACINFRQHSHVCVCVYTFSLQTQRQRHLEASYHTQCMLLSLIAQVWKL